MSQFAAVNQQNVTKAARCVWLYSGVCNQQLHYLKTSYSTHDTADPSFNGKTPMQKLSSLENDNLQPEIAFS